MAVTPRVIDISHHNEVYDFKMVATAGVWGVIHKATQGKAYVDPNYAGRRVLAGDGIHRVEHCQVDDRHLPFPERARRSDCNRFRVPVGNDIRLARRSTGAPGGQRHDQG